MRETVRGRLYIGFSGGEDSSLVSILAKMALGRDGILLVTIDWGDMTYSRSREIVRDFVKRYDMPHVFIDSEGLQKRIWRYGPSCNSCTKYVKIPLLKRVAGGNLVATGANAFDTWGKTGLKLHNGVYAPLSGLKKEEIRSILKHLGIEIERIGESDEREGCKLKNLLKMLINPEYHGKAVALSNEILMEILRERGIRLKRASVKIVGPLSRNIAVVVLEPEPGEDIKETIRREISSLESVDEVVMSSEVSKVVVVASPPIYRNESARDNVKRVIGIPGEYVWIESKNNRLRTFQVVEVIRG